MAHQNPSENDFSNLTPKISDEIVGVGIVETALIWTHVIHVSAMVRVLEAPCS
jgi:hypothetical protein